MTAGAGRRPEFGLQFPEHSSPESARVAARLGNRPLARVARITSVVMVLAGLFYVLNPYWFGDAGWYALDIASDEPLHPDWSHLLWRPLGKGMWLVAQALGLGLDPLTVLRALSSLSAAGLCMLAHALALRFGVTGGPALAAAALVAGSGTYLHIGGSGAAGPAATLLGVAAVMVLLRPTREGRGGEPSEWQTSHGLLACLAIGASFAFWAPTMFMMPLIFIAAVFRSNGGWTRRLTRALLVCAGGGVVIALVSAAAYGFFVRSPGGPSFLEWVSVSSHGVPASFSVISLPAAGLGFLKGLVYLGDLGRSVKGLLLGDPATMSVAEFIGWGLLAIWVVLLVAAGVVGLEARRRRGDPAVAWLGAMTLVALVPGAVVAALWAGADVQQLTLAMPFLAVALTMGLSQLPIKSLARLSARGVFVWVAVASVWSANLGVRVVPSLLDRGGLIMSLGEVARQHLPEHSLVVVTGQDFRNQIAAGAEYFSQINVWNVMDDVEARGADGWDRRLRSRLARALARGRSIAVLSDLLGQPTPGGIGLVTGQYPVPRMEDVAAFFAGWVRVNEWGLDRYRFVELRPPESWTP